MRPRPHALPLLLACLLASNCQAPPEPASKSSAQQDASPPAPPPDAPAPPEPPPPPTNTTINEFYARGTPTFIVGTAGDDAADRGIAAQVELIRGTVFPSATVVADTTIPTDPSAWPSNPVVYGGPHVNALLARLELPVSLAPGRLELGGVSFEGDGYQLIAAIPAGPHNPEFLLYAGTGTPGVAEINAVKHGGEGILIIDAFGRLQTGTWTSGSAGIEAKLDESARRIAWRFVERESGPVRVEIGFPEQLPAASDEAAVIDALARGITRASEQLQVSAPTSLRVYVHPDPGSKKSLTGFEGDGHAVAMAATLHVLTHDPSDGGPLELLVAHEATHVLAHASWGAAGMPLLGEGLAVHVAGQYGGVKLETWARKIKNAPTIAELLGPGFRKRPEAETYPIAGLLVRAAIDHVGLDNTRTHLYGATPQTWAEACERAGTSASALEQALADAIGR